MLPARPAPPCPAPSHLQLHNAQLRRRQLGLQASSAVQNMWIGGEAEKPAGLPLSKGRCVATWG